MLSITSAVGLPAVVNTAQWAQQGKTIWVGRYHDHPHAVSTAATTLALPGVPAAVAAPGVPAAAAVLVCAICSCCACVCKKCGSFCRHKAVAAWHQQLLGMGGSRGAAAAGIDDRCLK
jgi:hypothetical protein